LDSRKNKVTTANRALDNDSAKLTPEPPKSPMTQLERLLWEAKALPNKEHSNLGNAKNRPIKHTAPTSQVISPLSIYTAQTESKQRETSYRKL